MYRGRMPEQNVGQPRIAKVVTSGQLNVIFTKRGTNPYPCGAVLRGAEEYFFP